MPEYADVGTPPLWPDTLVSQIPAPSLARGHQVMLKMQGQAVFPWDHAAAAQTSLGECELEMKDG